MLTFNDTLQLFPSVDSSKKVVLANFYLWILAIFRIFIKFEYYLSFFGIVLTIFHLTILTRKSMRTTSIISIMIGIAICDLISMIEAIVVRDIVLNFEVQDCTPPLTYFAYNFFEICNTIRDDVIRISTWLSVTMALIRYLVLKLSMKPVSTRISRFPFGFYVLGIATVISTGFSIIFYWRAKIVASGEWKPADSCTDKESLSLIRHPIYKIVPSDLFTAYDGLIHHVFMFLNGTFSKILPCLLFPILTGLLILELRKAEKNRKVSSDKNNTERTTALVIFMTVSFFIALLPTGIMTSLEAVYTDIGFLYINSYIEFICSALLTLNATLHCFICFAMSTQYRKTVRNLFMWKKKKGVNDK